MSGTMPSFTGNLTVSSVNATEPEVSKPSTARILITDNPAQWKNAVEERLDYLCRLSKGWDGYSADPVQVSTANFALDMMNSICRPDVPTPSIVPGTNGDLQIEWHLQNGDIELHVIAPHDVHAYRETAQTGEDGEELSLTKDFTEVMRWIKDLMDSVHAPIATAT
jgi:hypothetical protein